MLKEIKGGLNKWKAIHVHGFEDEILLKWQNFPK